MERRDITRGLCFSPVTKTGKLETFHAVGQAWKGNCDAANNITDLLAVNPHDAYYIKGLINSYPVHFMLDTGAAVCLLDTSVWDRIKGKATLLPWASPGLVGVAGIHHSKSMVQQNYR